MWLKTEFRLIRMDRRWDGRSSDIVTKIGRSRMKLRKMEQRSTISVLFLFETRNACSFSYWIGFWRAIYEARTPVCMCLLYAFILTPSMFHHITTNVCVRFRLGWICVMVCGARSVFVFVCARWKANMYYYSGCSVFSLCLVRLECRVDFSIRFVSFISIFPDVKYLAHTDTLADKYHYKHSQSGYTNTRMYK